MLILVMFWLLIKLCAPWYMYIFACVASLEILVAWGAVVAVCKTEGAKK